MYDSEERHSVCCKKSTHTKPQTKTLEIDSLFSVQHQFWSCQKATPSIKVSINKLERQFEANTLIEE